MLQIEEEQMYNDSSILLEQTQEHFPILDRNSLNTPDPFESTQDSMFNSFDSSLFSPQKLRTIVQKVSPEEMQRGEVIKQFTLEEDQNANSQPFVYMNLVEDVSISGIDHVQRVPSSPETDSDDGAIPSGSEDEAIKSPGNSMYLYIKFLNNTFFRC